MLDVMIEQWKNLNGSTDYLWSVWREGQRIEMGGAHDTADAAEEAAIAFCNRKFGTEPVDITRL